MKLFNETEGRIKKLGAQYPELLPLMQPTAKWFGVGGKKVKKTFDTQVRNYINRCGNDIPVVVLYNIPNRDLGNHSKGGAKNAEDYLFFINEMVQGLGENSNAVVIIEPDAMALVKDYDMLVFRQKLLLRAVEMLKTTGAKLYLDIGHPHWHSSQEASKMLFPFMGEIDGVSINVSNYIPTTTCVQYAKEIYDETKLHAVIDTSRNGQPTHNGEWCNPSNRRIGHAPTLDVSEDFIDGYLWIKVPGESDGTCNGGPKAGMFWLENALELARKDR